MPRRRRQRAITSRAGNRRPGVCGVAGIVAALVAVAPRARADDQGALFELVDAAAQRLQTAEPVAAYKWRGDSPIEDPPRVQQVLDAVTTDATAHGIDAGYVRQVFGDQINATDAIEYSRFAQWKLDPAGAPTAPPELAASRDTIDALNHRMVGQIALHWDVLTSPSCGRELDEAKSAVADGRRLDVLYRQALSYATHSYCRV